MANDQLQKNLAAFEALQETREAENAERTVLLHNGMLVAIHNDSGGIYSIGVEKFGLGNFLIETFGETPKSPGYFTTFVGRNGVAA